MIGLHLFVHRTKLGKAMQATAQDQEAARMMGVDVDRVIVTTFFLGSALAGAAGLIFGLYYDSSTTSSATRRASGLHRGGAGRHRQHPRCRCSAAWLIGLIETLGGQFIAVAWTDVIIFSILVLVLVFRPTGLLGRLAAQRS